VAVPRVVRWRCHARITRTLRPLVGLAVVGCLLVAGQSAASVHRVRRGDTLWALAKRYGVSVGDLARANGIRNPDRIVAGRAVRIPAGGAVTGKGAGAGRPAPPSARPPAGSGRGSAASRKPPAGLARDDRAAVVRRLDRWAAAYRVPPDLLKALTWWESGWQNEVVSSAGAVGIGQLMPDTVTFVSRDLLRTPLNPSRSDDNIRMTARFLRYMLDQSGGSTEMALAGYYQGLASVRTGRIYDDTKRYVAGISALRARFR
jgi:murein DD-endopeptidase MepM/ murein hydrolase activator NlpD